MWVLNNQCPDGTQTAELTAAAAINNINVRTVTIARGGNEKSTLLT
jgi:hypothetical protein